MSVISASYETNRNFAIHPPGDRFYRYSAAGSDRWLVEGRQRCNVAIECTEISPCDQILFVPDITLSRVFIEVDGEGLEFEGEFIPT
jgi:hypothetical protein